MQKRKLIVNTLLIVILTMALTIVYRATTCKSKQKKILKENKLIKVNKDAITNLSEAFSYETISHKNPSLVNDDKFKEYYDFLLKTFPRVHNNSEIIDIEGSRIYRFGNGNENGDKRPVGFFTHIDVVPVDAERWKYPPFDGEIAEGYVWGRGALDIKSNGLAIFEALEYLIANNQEFDRDIYFIISNDEETGGLVGTKSMANYLRNKGIQFEYLMDEGGFVINDAIVEDQDIAFVGIAEKGYLSVKLTVKGETGHSSIPSKSAITTLSELILDIEKMSKDNFPLEIDGATQKMLEYLAPEMNTSYRALMSNLWISSEFLEKALSKNPSFAAMLHTTFAPTILNSGSQENVMPSSAEVIINFRIIQGDSIEKIVSLIKEVISNKKYKNVTLALSEFISEPSKISSVDSLEFNYIAETVRELYPEVIVAPYLVTGATDSRYFGEISNNVYRFTPIRIEKLQTKEIHGINEKIAVDSYQKAIEFYIHFIDKTSMK